MCIRDRAQAAFPAPEDGAVQPRKARRFRANMLQQPLAQPTSRPLVSVALLLASVQEKMLPWLPIAAAISLVQCCRSLHGGGLFIAGRLADGRRRVEDSVEYTLFNPVIGAGLAQAGVSRSTILRTLACAIDLLEKCPPVFVDESMLPLAFPYEHQVRRNRQEGGRRLEVASALGGRNAKVVRVSLGPGAMGRTRSCRWSGMSFAASGAMFAAGD